MGLKHVKLTVETKKKIRHTLKRVPIEENFDCLESSGAGGNRFATKEHVEAFNNA